TPSPNVSIVVNRAAILRRAAARLRCRKPAPAGSAPGGDKSGNHRRSQRRTIMTYSMKQLSCDPGRIRGMSERMIVSHYENNYGGAVKRLNLIEEQLAGLDFTKTPGFLINGLKREQLIATNSMILHEVFFAGLGDESEPGASLKEALSRDF